jgi:hypothetical protein
MKLLFQSPAYLALVVLMYSCNQPGIKKDMVRFDEAFVPVFYHVYYSDLEKASNAMYLLDSRWQQFNDKYQILFRGDVDGLERLRYIDDWHCDANDAIIRGDRHTALMQLDHIRYEMMEIRRSYKMEYFLDYLWDFEGGLTMLAEASCEDNTLICSANEIAFLVEETQYLWEIVEEAKNMPFSKIPGTFDAVLYEQHKREVSENMKLVEAEKNSSYKDLSVAVEKTFNAYMKLLTQFGDFETIPTFYAKSL